MRCGAARHLVLAASKCEKKRREMAKQKERKKREEEERSSPPVGEEKGVRQTRARWYGVHTCSHVCVNAREVFFAAASGVVCACVELAARSVAFGHEGDTTTRGRSSGRSGTRRSVPRSAARNEKGRQRYEKEKTEGEGARLRELTAHGLPRLVGPPVRTGGNSLPTSGRGGDCVLVLLSFCSRLAAFDVI